MQLYYVHLTMELPTCGTYGKGNITAIAQIILHFFWYVRWNVLLF